MRLNSLLRTTAIRLALRYAAFFALQTAIGMGVLYWATSRYMSDQIGGELVTQMGVLIRHEREVGPQGLLHLLEQQAVVNATNGRYPLLVTPSGEKLAGTMNDWPPGLLPNQELRNVWIEDELFSSTLDDRDGFWPMIAATLPNGNRLLLAQSVAESEDLEDFVLGAMSFILTLTVAVTLLLGWRMGRQMLRRVDEINGTVHQSLRGDLSGRVRRSQRNDEFDELASHLNRMLAHIESLVEGMRNVTDNVAHDLRHPLTRLRSRLEVSLLATRDPQESRRAMEAAVVDADEIIHTFNALLEIAQTEAGSFREAWDDVDLSVLVDDLGALYKDRVEELGQSMCLVVEGAAST